MPVLGLTIDSIEAKKISSPKGKVNIQNNPSIKDLKEIDLGTLGKKALDIRFEHSLSYTEPGKDKKGKEVAYIKTTGNVLFLTENNEKILKEWKDKKLASEIAIPVLNNIIKKCLTRCMGIAEELQLPLPLRVPTLKAAKDSPRYIG